MTANYFREFDKITALVLNQPLELMEPLKLLEQKKL
jgi:hypothetical protein